MKRIAALGMTVALFSGVCAFAQDFTTAQVMAKLDEKAKVFTSLQANLKSVKVNYGAPVGEQTGKLVMAKEKETPRVVFDIAEPRKTKIVVDKGKGTMYYPDDNTFREKKASEDALQFLLIGFGASAATISKGYDAEARGREPIGGVNAVVLELKSNSKSTEAFPLLKLWLDPQTWTPVQTRISQSLKSYDDYKDSNVQLNRQLSDSAFKLQMKAGAKQQ
jgi:outer membrane lipoprotein-sorting protein